MRNILRMAVPVLTCAALFTSCGPVKLPDDHVVFSQNTINIEENGSDISVITIEYSEKVYYPFGKIKLHGLEINGLAFGSTDYAFGDCIGYVGDDQADKVFELKNELSDRWLIRYYTPGIMMEPVVYRALSEKDDPDIPDSVVISDYCEKDE